MSDEIDLIAGWKKGHIEELLKTRDWSQIKKKDFPIPFQRLIKFIEEVRDGELHELRIDGNGNPISCKHEGNLVYFQDVN